MEMASNGAKIRHVFADTFYAEHYLQQYYCSVCNTLHQNKNFLFRLTPALFMVLSAK
jgi:hypothetical protein